MLVDKGVLYKRRGIGMFVAPGARELLLAERRTAFADRYRRAAPRRGPQARARPRRPQPTDPRPRERPHAAASDTTEGTAR